MFIGFPCFVPIVPTILRINCRRKFFKRSESSRSLGQFDDVCPLGQLVQVVQLARPNLNLCKPLLDVPHPVVAAPVGILHGMRHVGFNRQGVGIELVHQHGACRRPEFMPGLLFAKVQRVQRAPD